MLKHSPRCLYPGVITYAYLYSFRLGLAEWHVLWGHATTLSLVVACALYMSTCPDTHHPENTLFAPLIYLQDLPLGMGCIGGSDYCTCHQSYATTFPISKSSCKSSVCTTQTFQNPTYGMTSCCHHHCHMMPPEWWHLSPRSYQLGHMKNPKTPATYHLLLAKSWCHQSFNQMLPCLLFDPSQPLTSLDTLEPPRLALQDELSQWILPLLLWANKLLPCVCQIR